MTPLDGRHKTVWVDLTDMLVWRGHFTGIQRVVYEYASRFAKDGARFFAYDKIDQRFFEVPTAILDTQNRDIAGTDGPREVVTTRLRIRRFLGKPYYSLPEKYRLMLRPTVDYANHIARGLMGLALHKPANKQPLPYADMPSASFSQDDTLVLLGAGWNEVGMADSVARLKTEMHVRVCQHINDILPIYQPQLFSDELVNIFTPYVQDMVNVSDVITVISEATKRDVTTYCKEKSIKQPDIEVIRLGDDVQVLKPHKPVGIQKGEKFLLSVGTFEIRKNYLLLYQAVKLAQLENRHLPKIVIAGKQGWLTHDIAHVIERDPYAKESILWLDEISDEELQWLYENCMFTVFPSLSEGWGLPVAESLRNGKLCIAAGVSSMLEIGEGLVDYFLPYDARECMEKIQYHVAEDRYITENTRVVKTYKTISWDDSYSQLKMSITRA